MTPTAHHEPRLAGRRPHGSLVGTVYNPPSPVVTSLLFNSSDAYDALDRFNRIIESRWKQSTTDLYKVVLGYDRNSNLLTADDSVQSGFDWKYTNDMLERLTQAQAGTLSGGSITSETRKQGFDLDQVGNWTHTDLVTGGSTTEFDWDFTHNKVNEITGWDNQTNNVTPTYDAAGNMADDKRDWKYEYDAWYRLVRVKDQSNNVKAEFVYNALGFRLSTRYDETAPWQHFAYDERWRILAMYEDDADASEPTEQFWYHNAGASGMGGSSYIDAVVLRDRDTDGNGSLDERRYYLQNQHHDVVALINTSGSISERINYDPYGSPIGTFTSIANRKGYAGYEYDAELGDTYHVRHRVYRSDLGVWTRRDPLGYVDGMGLYEYVMSRAVSLVDASGTASGRMDCGQNCYERYQLLLQEIFKGIPGCWGPGVASFGKCELACVLACSAALVFGIVGYKVCLAVCTAACIGRTLADFSTCWKRSARARDNAKHSYCLCLGWKVRHCGGCDEPDLLGCDPNDPLYHRGRCP